MRRQLIVIMLCLSYLFLQLYDTIALQNHITKLKLEIPNLSKQVQLIHQHITKLQFDIDATENPLSLMRLLTHPEFRSLKYPLNQDIITIE